MLPFIDYTETNMKNKLLRLFNIGKWLFNKHYWLVWFTTLCIYGDIHYLTSDNNLRGFFVIMSMIAYIIWSNILRKQRIIPLHKDWRDFGKTKTPCIFDEDDEDEEFEDEDMDEEERQEEFNSSISNKLDDLSSWLYFDEANAISYETEDSIDGIITVTLKYKMA
jgi:hypothetical protein